MLNQHIINCWLDQPCLRIGSKRCYQHTYNGDHQHYLIMAHIIAPARFSLNGDGVVDAVIMIKFLNLQKSFSVNFMLSSDLPIGGFFESPYI